MIIVFCQKQSMLRVNGHIMDPGVAFLNVRIVQVEKAVDSLAPDFSANDLGLTLHSPGPVENSGVMTLRNIWPYF